MNRLILHWPAIENLRTLLVSMKANYLIPSALTVAFLIVVAGCQKNESPRDAQEDLETNDGLSLSFGLYTTDKPSAVVAQFRPILNELEDELSDELQKPVTIKIDISSSYQKGINRIADGEVDFARLGPASFILAKEKNEQIQLVAMESNKGQKTFRGIIAVHAESSLTSLEELSGKDFAFGDERSTIGRYLSQMQLSQAGVRAKDLNSYEYLGRHDAVAAAVGSQKFHAGALKESTFRKMNAKGTPIKALTTFSNVTKPWVAREQLPVEVALALKKVLLELKSPDALQALGKQGFLEASFEDYRSVQQAMARNSEFFE